MKKFHTGYCDMDGLIADFHLEAVRAHMRDGRRFPSLCGVTGPLELTHDILYHVTPPLTHTQTVCCPELPNDVSDFWGPELEPFWAPIRKDPFFWSNMSCYSWTKELIELLHHYCDEVVFVTSPDKHHHSYHGKWRWMVRNHLSHYELITAHQKWRLAHPRCLLIDDSGKHVNQWKDQCDHLFREPGYAILFPQPWNQNYEHCHNRLAYTQSLLEGYTDK